MAVTGATGFLGRYVVAEALRRGHEVSAVVRPSADGLAVPGPGHPALRLVRDDLRRPTGLVDALRSVDVVVHLAAVKGGDFADQFAGTVVATENLLGAMSEAGVDRMVLTSTFSVYDHRGSHGTVDESTPLEAEPLLRDGYAQTKLLQEQLVRRFETEDGGRLTVLRPGIVYGREELWHSCLGVPAGDRFAVIGPAGVMPLAYVENCADAIVTSGERDDTAGVTANVVDGDLPTRWRFARELRALDPLTTIGGAGQLAPGARDQRPGLGGQPAPARRKGPPPRPPGASPARRPVRVLPIPQRRRSAESRLGAALFVARSAGPQPGLRRPARRARAGVTTMRVAYLTGTYPRPTDTFIQREVGALRVLGLDVHTFAVHAPSNDHVVGEHQRQERARTTYLLPPDPGRLLRAHGRLALRHPGRYLSAARRAWTTRALGLNGTLRQAAYFAEAGVLAAELRSRHIGHLHNHFADSSATVAMLAAELADATFSFTLHGPYVFFEAHRWRLDEKVSRARFVVCISHFARSQAMLFSPSEQWDRLRIVHCGVDARSVPVVHHHGQGGRLLYVGRLSAAKGLPVLLQSMGALAQAGHDTTLTVVGDGEDRLELIALAERLGVAGRVRLPRLPRHRRGPPPDPERRCLRPPELRRGGARFVDGKPWPPAFPSSPPPSAA